MSAMTTPGFSIANPSSCDDELSLTEGQDSYASLSGVESERVDKKEKKEKPILVAVGADEEWAQAKITREQLVHQRKHQKLAYGRTKQEELLNLSAVAQFDSSLTSLSSG